MSSMTLFILFVCIIAIIFLVLLVEIVGFVYELCKRAFKLYNKQISHLRSCRTTTSISYLKKINNIYTFYYLGGGVARVVKFIRGLHTSFSAAGNVVTCKRFFSSYSNASKYSLNIFKLRRSPNLFGLSKVFIRKILNIVFFIIPLSFIGRASYLSWVTPNLTILDALLNVSSDYITGGIFAGSLLVSLVTSVMEFNKIPDLFYLFSIVYKHINLSNKIDLGDGGFVNMMDGIGDKNPSSKSEGYGEKIDKLITSEKEASAAAVKYEKEAQDLQENHVVMFNEKKAILKKIPKIEASSQKDKLLALILAKRDKDGKALFDVFSESSTSKNDECRRLTAKVEEIEKQAEADYVKYGELLEKQHDKWIEADSLQNEINSLILDQRNNKDNKKK